MSVAEVWNRPTPKRNDVIHMLAMYSASDWLFIALLESTRETILLIPLLSYMKKSGDESTI